VEALILVGGELGRLRRGGRRGAPPELSGKRIAEHYRPYLDASENLVKEAAMEAEGFLREEALAAARDEAGGRDALARAGGELGRTLAAHEEGLRKRSRLWNHALPLLTAGFFLWSLAYPAVRGAFDRLVGESRASWGGVIKDLFLSIIEGLRPSFLANLVITVALTYLLSALFTWIRQVSRLEQAVTGAEGAAREHVERHGRGVAEHVTGLLARWQQERDDLDAMTRGP
jgi:hypothetical protein